MMATLPLSFSVEQIVKINFKMAQSMICSLGDANTDSRTSLISFICLRNELLPGLKLMKLLVANSVKLIELGT